MNTIKRLIEKNIMTAICAILCIGIGVFCILGWHTHALHLIQIFPGLTHMVYNTAINFLFLGGGLLILLSPYRKIASLCGLFVASIGVVTLGEYIFNVQLIIDEFFMKSFLTIDTYTPGRMSPYTALSFLSCGVSITLLSFDKYSRFYTYILIVLGSIIFSLSSTSILGSAISLSGNTQWYKFMPMALHTSIGFLLFCAGLVAYLFSKHLRGKIDLSSTLPAFAFMCSLCFTFLLWRSDYQENILKIQQLTILESEKIQNIIETKIEESVLDLMGLDSKGNMGAFFSEKDWIKSTEFYRKNHPWYDAILWVDPKFKVMFTSSFNKEITSNSQDTLLKHDLFEKAIINRGVSISPIVNFTDQSHGILICIPLYTESALEGFIVGFVNTDSLFKSIIQESTKAGFVFRIFQDNNQIYASPNIPASSFQEIVKQVDVKLYNLNWRFDIQPSQSLLNTTTHTVVSYFILVIGICIGSLLAAVIQARLVSKRQARVLEKTQILLKQELLESRRLSHDLSILKEMTDTLQACTSLAKAATIVVKYCYKLLPKTSGSIYLSNENQNILDSYGRWGRGPLNEPSFSTKNCKAMKGKLTVYKSGTGENEICHHTAPRTNNEVYVCLPLINHDKVIGLLQIRYPNDSKHFNKGMPSLEETLAKQLTLTLANIKLRELLKNQATRDPLTNLYNRRYLDEALPREIYQAKRYNHPLSVLMLDIDHFKTINDTYGHKAGDMVLKNVASVLQALSRKGDISCRYGGEEFLIVLQESTIKDAVKHAQKLRKEVAGLSFSWKGKDMKSIKISIGVASYPAHGEFSEDLIGAADEALYRAKNGGRNRVESAIS